MSLPRLSVTGNKIVEKGTTNKVNLHGVSLHNMSEFFRYKSTDIINIVATWPANLVRLPIMPTNLNHQAYEAFLDSSIVPVIDHVNSQNMYFIIDWHCVGSIYANDSTSFWTTVAKKFKNRTNVMYELHSQSTENIPWLHYRDHFQKLVDTIRTEDPEGLIISGGPNYSMNLGDAVDNPLSGGNILYSAKIFPNNYAAIKDQIDLVTPSYPVVITEWGYNGQWYSEDQYSPNREDFARDFLSWTDNNDIGWTAWCASHSTLPAMFQNRLLELNDYGRFVKDAIATRN